jgi:hypothetical protein
LSSFEYRRERLGGSNGAVKCIETEWKEEYKDAEALESLRFSIALKTGDARVRHLDDVFMYIDESLAGVL